MEHSDTAVYGNALSATSSHGLWICPTAPLGWLTDSVLESLRAILKSYSHVTVLNNFKTVEELQTHLGSLDLFNGERLRPSWDSYFMTLSELAARRCNCMKRRVGAILVRNNRIVATG